MDLMDVPEPGASADPWGSGVVSKAAAASEDPWQAYGRNAGEAGVGGGCGRPGSRVGQECCCPGPAAFLPRPSGDGRSLWEACGPPPFLRFNKRSGPSWEGLGAGPGSGVRLHPHVAAAPELTGWVQGQPPLTRALCPQGPGPKPAAPVDPWGTTPSVPPLKSSDPWASDSAPDPWSSAAARPQTSTTGERFPSNTVTTR